MVTFFRVHDSQSGKDTTVPPAANADGEEIHAFLNATWKQVVLKNGAVDAYPDVDLPYDENDNGLLDYYATGENPEFEALQTLAGENRAVLVREFAMRYRLAADGLAGQNFVELEPSAMNEFMQPGQHIALAGGGVADEYTVVAQPGDDNKLYLAPPLLYDYDKTLFLVGWVSIDGLSTDPIIMGNFDTKERLLHVLTHELCHWPSVAGLADVSDENEDNLMSRAVGTKLRAREIKLRYESDARESQWLTTDLHR
ncbi:MAG: hypothetical protein U1E76_21970 [Planctomycetota bacterium]